MKLRLYKQPHSESVHSSPVRLLFEGAKENVRHEGYEDFYIYVWIDHSGLLIGFQAILDDRITMTSINGSDPIITCVSNDVIERSTTGLADDEDSEKIRIAVGSMVSDDFPLILDRIKMSMFGENIRHIRLTEGELKKFKKLCREL